MNIISIVNKLREERNLPKVVITNPTTITREVLKKVALAVWEKYPGALTSPTFELGELTADLVQKEVNLKIHDLRRGIKIRQGSISDSNF